MILPTHIKKHIKTHAIDEHPKECCGLIVENNKKYKALKCRNVSVTPSTSFSLDPIDYLRHSSKGEIRGVYHSHREGSDFSESDKTNSCYHEVNYIMYNLKDNSFHEFSPKKQQILYLNKPFKIGVNDCFTLVRDYLEKNFNIHFSKEVSEAYSFGAQKQNLSKAIQLIDEVTLNHGMEGFVKMFISNAADFRKNDILVMGLKDENEPMHLAIYLGNEMIMHHPRNKYATTEKINDPFFKRLIYIYRPK